MAKIFVSLVALAVTAAGVLCAAGPAAREIFLPPDADVVTIVGRGFKLELSQFEAIRGEWRATEREAAAVPSPRPEGDDRVVVNTDPGEQARALDAGSAGEEPRELDEDLLRWVEDRATSLVERVQRYQEEEGEPALAQRFESRVVLHILTLNTLVDLDNLAAEGLRRLKWLRTKLRALAGRIARGKLAGDVEQFVRAKIHANAHEIEPRVTGTNDPGLKWVTNTQALKRVLHEQRFSRALGQLIVDFLGGHWNLMQRSNVFELNQPKRLPDDGLLYFRAKGRVPAFFPFAAQDAIANGAFV